MEAPMAPPMATTVTGAIGPAAPQAPTATAVAEAVVAWACVGGAATAGVVGTEAGHLCAVAVGMIAVTMRRLPLAARPACMGRPGVSRATVTVVLVTTRATPSRRPPRPSSARRSRSSAAAMAIATPTTTARSIRSWRKLPSCTRRRKSCARTSRRWRPWRRMPSWATCSLRRSSVWWTVVESFRKSWTRSRGASRCCSSARGSSGRDEPDRHTQK
mmetsp:Transcript_45060/g.127203  ORF Transcript_45060/g.127203 Transcript_45060/m.127203 type:complete len:216 (-) Transcript_45060:73-720(-)